jgi:hypothetical protein
VTVRRAAVWALRRPLLPLAVLVAQGLTDLARHLPGPPRVPLALPLRETGHQDAVGLVWLLAVWLAVFALVGRLSPPERLPAVVVALLRGLLATAAAIALQAASLELVRQAVLGLDWRGALTSAPPWIAGACAAAGAYAGARAAVRT